MEAIYPSPVERSTPEHAADYLRFRPTFFAGNRATFTLLREWASQGYLERPPVAIVLGELPAGTSPSLPTGLAPYIYERGSHSVVLDTAGWTALTPAVRYRAVLHGIAHHLLGHPTVLCPASRKVLCNPVRGLEISAHLLGGQLSCVPGLGGHLARFGVLNPADGAWLELVDPARSAPDWIALEHAAAREEEYRVDAVTV